MAETSSARLNNLSSSRSSRVVMKKCAVRGGGGGGVEVGHTGTSPSSEQEAVVEAEGLHVESERKHTLSHTHNLHLTAESDF